jgi:glutamate formiminotransferase/formiminotetrahydrofolate cyclodeaminase
MQGYECGDKLIHYLSAVECVKYVANDRDNDQSDYYTSDEFLAVFDRIWRELGIPCYCYGAAASSPERAELSWCRKGEYEALAVKLADPVLRPDFGPGTVSAHIARTGATNVGARPFLIAVNFNLRPDGQAGLAAAKAIARRMRGPGCKAIGWYIEEYGCAQVSMNLTDTSLAPLHEVYEKVCREAEAEGWRISGTEIIGLVPRQVLLDAGNGSLEAAIRRLHLDDLRPFLPEEKVLENLLPI